MKKTKIQMIGNYLENMTYPLERRNIKVESLISLCNPMAMAGPKNGTIAARADEINHMLTQLMAKGNLGQMLSHSKENFCSNYKYLPEGKEVRYQNGSEYIVVCNNGCGLRLYVHNGFVYSDTHPKNELIESIQKDKNTMAVDFPYTFLDWKALYDHFIDSILDEYDSEHIILIRTNAMRWYQEGSRFTLFDDRARDFRNQVEQMDIRFAERTGCHCVDVQYAHVSNNNNPITFRYSGRTPAMYKDLEYALDEIINHKSSAYRQKKHGFRSPLVVKLCRLLTSEVLARNEGELRAMEEQFAYRLTEVKGDSPFINDLRHLCRFIDGDWRYSPADYLVECTRRTLTGEDIDLIELVTTYCKLGMDDIAGIYQLYADSTDKSLFRKIVSNICSNSDCYPLCDTERFVEKNRARLADYAYVDKKLLSAKAEGQYIRLENGCLLVLDPNGPELMRVFNGGVSGSADYKRVIENNYVCPLGEADALCGNWDFYIARAREGKGNHPVTIPFASAEEFALSLRYIDYTDLLDNEYFVLALADTRRSIDLKHFKTRTNLNFLYEKGTGIFHVRAGLGDQIIYYISSRRLQIPGLKNVYYDDVWTNSVGAVFNGTEIHKIVKEDIEDRLFSRLLSSKLIVSVKDMTIADHLYTHGCTEICGISNDERRFATFKKCPRLYVPDVFAGTVSQTMNLGIPYYNCWIVPARYIENRYFRLNDYIQFPPFESGDPNEAVFNCMKNCDSVVVHVRRGDHVSLGRDLDNSYYREALERLCAIPDYPNKKLFVFSDDIPWCRENPEQLGLDLFPASDITYVDFNKEETSFRDIQLMAQGKIFIAAASGFSQMATLLTEHCEVMMSPVEGWMTTYEKCVRKNKYDIGRFAKNYTPNFTVRAPKPVAPAVPAAKTAVSTASAETIPTTVVNTREKNEWLNFWYDMGNQSRNDRILMIGDSVSREFRTKLAQIVNRPVDFFATSMSIVEEFYWEQLRLFFSAKEYRQVKAYIQIGYHEINDVEGRNRVFDVQRFEQSYEKLIVMVKGYIPDVTISTYPYLTKPNAPTIVDEGTNAQINTLNEAVVRLAKKHGIPVNDLYKLTFENQHIYKHRDRVHYVPEVQELLAMQVAKALKLK